METLGSLRRTNYCGEVTLAMAGQEMTVCGSIARARDKGGIIFADLRDTTGILQLVFDEDTPKDVFAKAESLKSEYVVICRGKLRERAAKTDKIATGDVELYVSELRILSEAQTTPFELRDEINVNDDLRLRYRYLDLRRPSMHEPIVLRSKIMQIIRNYFCENHFTEIETPTLIKSTPEGARDYLVPSRVQPGHFYALPQSPQLYKQILMLSGFDSYFQLAHCYRDEDLRADRQPEFTQVDEEMSFVSEDDIMTLNEGLIKRLWKEMLNVDVETPFYRMPWDEAMGRFGSDKHDTRFGLEIQDVTEVFRGTEFKPFAAVLEAGGTIRAINAKGLADKLSRKNIDKLGEVAKTYGAKGLAYSRLTADGTSSSFEKFLTDAEKAALYAALNAETGDVLLLVSDTDWVKACTALGQVRLDIARNAEDLAFADVEVDVTEALGVDGREVLDLKHDLTGRIRARRVEVRQLTSDHLGNDHIGGQFLGLPGADVLAVAHDRDFVADAKNFIHLVADVDDGDALGAQLVHDGEQCLDLSCRQRGGRLVEDQHLAVCGDRLGDLNQLHLGNAQGSELGVRIIIQMDFLQDLGRILIHFVMVDNGDGSVFLGGIAPNVDILAYGAFRDGLQLLVHHRNAAVQCIKRALDLDLLPLINDLAFVHVVDTKHALHQGRLARAVLSHQRMDGAGFQFQLCVIQCLDAGERLDDITHLQAVL